MERHELNHKIDILQQYLQQWSPSLVNEFHHSQNPDRLEALDSDLTGPALNCFRLDTQGLFKNEIGRHLRLSEQTMCNRLTEVATAF